VSKTGEGGSGYQEFGPGIKIFQRIRDPVWRTPQQNAVIKEKGCGLTRGPSLFIFNAAAHLCSMFVLPFKT